MLSVSVDGDDAVQRGKRLADMGKGGLECPALPLVHAVMDHRADGILLRLVKPALMCLVAAVIHNDDMLKTVLDQAFDHSRELLIRVQRGQNDRRRLPDGMCILHSVPQDWSIM